VAGEGDDATSGDRVLEPRDVGLRGRRCVVGGVLNRGGVAQCFASRDDHEVDAGWRRSLA